MRYALRNQKKISSILGADFLKELLQSCDWHFANCEIKIIQKHPDNEPYNMIEVYNGKLDTTYVFYIINKKFDVYTLAFKKEVK